MSTNPAVVNTGNDALPSSYPDLDATSPTDSVIAGDFGQMSSADQVSSYIYQFVIIPFKKYTRPKNISDFCLKYFQERQRDEWKSELAKTEEEIMTLKQVLASKEAHAAGLKRRLGITQWREFSEDMAQGLKNLQVKNLLVIHGAYKQ